MTDVPLGARVILRSLHGDDGNGRCRECAGRVWPCPSFHFVFHNENGDRAGCGWCRRNRQRLAVKEDDR